MKSLVNSARCGPVGPDEDVGVRLASTAAAPAAIGPPGDRPRRRVETDGDAELAAEPVDGDLELERADAGEDRGRVGRAAAPQDVDDALLGELREAAMEVLVAGAVEVADVTKCSGASVGIARELDGLVDVERVADPEVAPR